MLSKVFWKAKEYFVLCYLKAISNIGNIYNINNTFKYNLIDIIGSLAGTYFEASRKVD